MPCCLCSTWFQIMCIHCMCACVVLVCLPCILCVVKWTMHVFFSRLVHNSSCLHMSLLLGGLDPISVCVLSRRIPLLEILVFSMGIFPKILHWSLLDPPTSLQHHLWPTFCVSTPANQEPNVILLHDECRYELSDCVFCM
jgi:hypothetical protein